MIQSGKPASVALNPFELHPQLQTAIPVSAKKPLEDVEGLKEEFARIEGEGIRHLVRYSGTENKLRILLEGKDPAKLQHHFDGLVAFLKQRSDG